MLVVRNSLGDDLHHHHYATSGNRVVYVSYPRHDLMNAAHVLIIFDSQASEARRLNEGRFDAFLPMSCYLTALLRICLLVD